MELWKVRKEYRRAAMSLRRRPRPLEPHLVQMEEQVLISLVLCDRYETEVSVLRLARRCARARLRRLRHWVENAGIFKSAPRPLARKADEPAADELARGLEQLGRESGYVRQVLDEVAHLERRFGETHERLLRVTATSVEGLQLLLGYLQG